MLSRSSEYAVRALTYMGARADRPWLLSRGIAEELGIPPPFLAKILQTLAGAGILESQRGRGGGFRLLRTPESLSLYEIVEPFDNLGHRTLCVLGQKLCGDETACPLHYAWKASRDTFLDALHRTSLADVERMDLHGSFPWGAKPVPATSD
jgi:Rrf2 family transcriptional regulator, iron-sulfur cluster assembly transcription factor